MRTQSSETASPARRPCPPDAWATLLLCDRRATAAASCPTSPSPPPHHLRPLRPEAAAAAACGCLECSERSMTALSICTVHKSFIVLFSMYEVLHQAGAARALVDHLEGGSRRSCGWPAPRCGRWTTCCSACRRPATGGPGGAAPSRPPNPAAAATYYYSYRI